MGQARSVSHKVPCRYRRLRAIAWFYPYAVLRPVQRVATDARLRSQVRGIPISRVSARLGAGSRLRDRPPEPPS